AAVRSKPPGRQRGPSASAGRVRPACRTPRKRCIPNVENPGIEGLRVMSDRSSVQSEPPDAERARSYEIRTYGCQMNVHDSERLAGLLEDAGYVRSDGDGVADLVVFNTCAVRENADNKLYGN